MEEGSSGSTKETILVICAVVFVLVYSTVNLVPLLFPEWYNEEIFSSSFETVPSIYADCTEIDGKNQLTITVSSYSEEDLEDIECVILESSGLTPKESSKRIASLSSGSTDICVFEFEGTYESPIRFSVNYDDDASITQVAECYSYEY